MKVELNSYYARLRGIVSDAFRDKRILAVGTGAGSYMLEKLARLGPRELLLVDPDVVDVANLCRTTFTLRDVGRHKVSALADRIRDVNPAVAVQGFAIDVCTADMETKGRLLDGVDLIIAGTDSFSAQALLNLWSLEVSCPAVFIGIHEGAEGGRVIWSDPRYDSPCYRCIASERYEAATSMGSETTDLQAGHGALPDIQFIDMVALKVCVALLERGQSSPFAGFCTQMEGRTEVVVRTSPNYTFGNRLWDAILGDLPAAPKPFASELKNEALFAMDTIWLRTHRDPACPDCQQFVNLRR